MTNEERDKVLKDARAWFADAVAKKSPAPIPKELMERMTASEPQAKEEQSA